MYERKYCQCRKSLKLLKIVKKIVKNIELEENYKYNNFCCIKNQNLQELFEIYPRKKFV